MKVSATAVVLVLAIAAGAGAQVNLWTGPGAEASAGGDANLVRPVKARGFEIHEIISVIVNVSADATTEEEADLEKKDSKNQLSIEQYLKLRREGLSVNLTSDRPDDLGMDFSADRKYENEGSSGRSDILRARLAAEVVDIKPNGNLVIQARQQFMKQREKTVITLTGVIRPEDVLPNNIVYSYNVADVDIRYESSGPVTDASRRGWLGKIVDKVWPF